MSLIHVLYSFTFHSWREYIIPSPVEEVAVWYSGGGVTPVTTVSVGIVVLITVVIIPDYAKHDFGGSKIEYI